MSNEEISDTTATSAVEAQVSNPVLTEAGLTQAFMDATNADMQEVEEVEATEESQEVEEPEAVEVAEESEAENTETEAEVDEDVEEAEESEEAEAEEGDNVLSKQDKTVKKMRKRIDKATKNWRTAQEETESMKIEIEQLKEQISSNSGDKTSSDQSFKEIAKKADSIDELQAVYDKAEKAEEWIEDALDQLRDSGEDELEINGTRYTKPEITAFRKEVRTALKKDIPKRAQMFEQRTQYDERALRQFEFLSDPESDGYKHAENVMSDKGLGEYLSSRADQMHILGLLAEGILSSEAKQNKQSSSRVDKTKDAVKKPASTQKIAPKVPFVGSKVANTRSTPSEKSSQARKDLMNKGSLNERDLTQLFMSSNG